MQLLSLKDLALTAMATWSDDSSFAAADRTPRRLKASLAEKLQLRASVGYGTFQGLKLRQCLGQRGLPTAAKVVVVTCFSRQRNFMQYEYCVFVKGSSHRNKFNAQDFIKYRLYIYKYIVNGESNQKIVLKIISMETKRVVNQKIQILKLRVQQKSTL